MNRTTLGKWLNPKLILFGIAVFNFVVLWSAATRMGGIACVACPWFFPWSYFNPPTLLLLATVALLFSRKWTYVIAMGLPGYLIGNLIYLHWIYDLSFGDFVRLWISPYSEFLYAFQNQYVLALLVLIAATFYLAKRRC